MDSQVAASLFSKSSSDAISSIFLQDAVQISCNDILLSFIGSSQDIDTCLSQGLSSKRF